MDVAVTLAVASLGVLLVLPGPLARARWPHAAPSYALVLWQALGLSGGILALELLGTLALLPYGPTHLLALAGLVADPLPVRWWAVLAGVAFLLLLGRLLTVLLRSAARTLHARRSHRLLVDVVATRNPLLPRALVLDHDLPIAYCLPGLRPRVVLSRGVVQALREDELRAVLAHESAHVEQRHDLVVLPFAALCATFPRLPAVRTASAQVGLLVEMLADDRAARLCSRPVLARALLALGAGVTPDGGLGVAAADRGGAEDVVLRLRRLSSPPEPLGAARCAAVVAAVVATLSLPAAVLLAPLGQLAS